MRVTGTHIENVSGLPAASPAAVQRFREWCKTIGIELDEQAATASRIRGRCAADFETPVPADREGGR